MHGAQVTATERSGKLAEAGAFVAAVRAELRKVTWPSRPELLKATQMIIVMSVILGITIGLLDWLLQLLLVDGVARIAR